MKRLSSIFDTDPLSPEGIEAEQLVNLITTYEKEHYLLPYLVPLRPLKKLWKEKAFKTKNLSLVLAANNY